MFTVEQRIWKHSPPHTEDTDYTGQWRWCVLDDGLVYDHYGTEAEAVGTAENLNDNDDADPQQMTDDDGDGEEYQRGFDAGVCHQACVQLDKEENRPES